MSGGSFRHVIIINKCGSVLRQAVRGKGCTAFGSELNVHIPTSTLTTYPDAGVVCGQPEFLPGRKDVLLNPVLLAEVLSPSSERHDRGLKFASYRQIPSLREYLIVAQSEAHVELYTRESEGRWTLTEATGPDAALLIPTLGVSLALGELYESVTFEEAAGLG